ncbi:unnamed protein product [Haemonchus placei]|uniref:BTB domain-containing protein n=1 Tax=Haemonchus placei TaxID=6290 RepID=A0A158QPY2_HAEPC|nr:unnamed protein product [Haemonchus placei]
MEAKRIRLDPEDEDSRDSNSMSSCGGNESTPSTSSSAEVSVEDLKSSDPLVIEKALKKLKGILRTKAAIVKFMTARSSEVFPVLIALLIKTSTDIPNQVPPWLSILRETISVIANCCNYSVTACMKMAGSKITHIAVRIFESSSVKQECKTSMARLVANMCMHKEPAGCIASNSSLVDRLVLMLEPDDSASTQALRAVRGLVYCSYMKVVLLSNAGHYLGKMLAAGKNATCVVEVLTALARRRVRDIGRQLAGSDCAGHLLKLFFSDEVQGAKELALMLCEGSTDMRDRMGDALAIQGVVESADDSAMNCKLLTTFAQEAWGRAALRESGALDFLISRLSSTSFNSSDKLAIVQPLRHFIHDTNGMAHLVRNRVFINTVIKDVQEFLAEFKVECVPEIITDEELYRPDSPLLMEIESGLQKKSDREESSRLHKDYSFLWGYTTPSSPAHSTWSYPLYSPPSSGAGSPSSAFSISPLASPNSSHGRLSDTGFDTDEGESLKGHGDIRNEPQANLTNNVLAEKVIESELWLLTWQAQEDANLPYLGREDIVNTILSYLSLAPSPDYRIGRVLRRLACSRLSMDSLLCMQFHTRVLHTLCIVPCRVVRYAKRCVRCERAAEFGKEVLREFASHVDSDFGDSFLVKRLSSDDFTTRVVAAIAKIALIRDRFRLGRMTSGQLPALDLLFESIRTLLLRDDFPAIANDTTYTGGPPLCAQIIGAISTLISPQRLRQILEIDAAVRPQERGQCMVEKNITNPEENMEMLVFETKEGEVLARVSMDAICGSSQYFQGMFTSDLFEKCSGRRRFLFNPEEEDCTAEDFTRFLHYLAGCRSQCTAISSAHTCVALIRLSDRYLCPALSEFVCSPHGPVRRILSGETLPVFLPVVLLAQTHERLVAMCLLTLIRYCTSSLVVDALRSICQSQLLVDTFIEQMKALTSSSQ